jgi:hypothetical protein
MGAVTGLIGPAYRRISPAVALPNWLVSSSPAGAGRHLNNSFQNQVESRSGVMLACSDVYPSGYA